MESSASESKQIQSRSKGEIPGQTRRKERLSRSKLKQAFLIDSDAKFLMYLRTVPTIVTAHIFCACQGSRARRERNAQHAGHAEWFCLL